ncbi:MAG: DUF72 domain-containing protein [Myxococcales bacterium]|nr:MAG: DUF72 domain-containing protein [Myxococcales bacterium]
MRIRVGISGWTYPPWRGVFYPPGLRQADELAFASRAFPSIELNGSFYSLMRPQSYRAWRAAVPEDFVFAVKGGRFITHMKRLKNAETALANFFASGLLCLGPKLGPILWQLPPTLRFEADVLRSFFDLLPKTATAVEKLARKHDARLAGRSQLEAEGEIGPVRHALEVRHESFRDPRYLDILREYGVASCVADSAGLYPVIDAATSDIAYGRLHGASELYVSGYSSAELRAWAERVRGWQRTRDVFVYFDNDVKVRAPFDALNLTRILEGKRPRPLPKSQSSVTEQARTIWPAWGQR